MSVQTLTPGELLAGSSPVVADIFTVKQGEVRKRGTVLGKITLGGKHVIVNSANADGSEHPVCILAEDVDATAGDVNADVYLSGIFNEAAVIFGGADTVATHRAALNDLNIHLKKVV